MAAKVKQNGSTLEIDTPERLFKTRTESFLPSFDVSADGQRFPRRVVSLQKQPVPDHNSRQLGHVVENAMSGRSSDKHFLPDTRGLNVPDAH